MVLRAIDPRVLRMLALLIVSAVAVVVYINLMFTQPQGRYMLQALPAVALLAALGLTHLPAPLGSRLIVAAPIVLLLFNVWCLAGVIVPAYWPPLARTIAPGVRIEIPPRSTISPSIHVRPRRLAAPAVRDLRDGSSVLVAVDIDAAGYDTIEIEMTGEMPGVTVARGAIMFATDARALRTGSGWSFRGARTARDRWCACRSRSMRCGAARSGTPYRSDRTEASGRGGRPRRIADASSSARSSCGHGHPR